VIKVFAAKRLSQTPKASITANDLEMINVEPKRSFLKPIINKVYKVPKSQSDGTPNNQRLFIRHETQQIVNDFLGNSLFGTPNLDKILTPNSLSKFFMLLVIAKLALSKRGELVPNI
jgi:hypothetical protein